MMKKWVNGMFFDMTAEEIAAMKAAQAEAEAYERTRPLTAEEVTALLIKQQINTLSVDDKTALRMVEFYPEWSAGQAYTAGYKVQYGSALWRCLQAHTSQAGWEPENAPALWTEICESHAGTLAILRQHGPDGGAVLHPGLCDLSLHQRHRQPGIQPDGGAGGAVCGSCVKKWH